MTRAEIISGRCKRCPDDSGIENVRAYLNNKGELVWTHWDQRRHDHLAEPDELTLRRIYGDR